MLTLRHGKCSNLIWTTSKYFDNNKKDNWLDDELVKKYILDVDKSEVLGNNVIRSPKFGLMPPQLLSSGCKTLTLIYKMPNKIFNGSNLGDNCLKWLLEIGKIVDVTVWVGHYYDFIKNTDHSPTDNIFEIILEGDKGDKKIARCQKDTVLFMNDYYDVDPWD